MIQTLPKSPGQGGDRSSGRCAVHGAEIAGLQKGVDEMAGVATLGLVLGGFLFYLYRGPGQLCNESVGIHTVLGSRSAFDGYPDDDTSKGAAEYIREMG